MNTVILGMFTATAVALVDVAFHLALGDPGDVNYLMTIWKQLSVTVCVYCGLYVALLFIVQALALLLSRHRLKEANRGVAVFVGSLALTMLAGDLLSSPADLSNPGNEFFQLGVCALISLLAVGLWVRMPRMMPAGPRNWTVTGLSFAVVTLAEIVVYLVVVHSVITGVSPLLQGAVLIGAVLLTGIVILPFRFGESFGVVLALLLFLFALGPIPLAVSQGIYTPNAVTAAKTDVAVKKVILITIDTMRADLLSAAAPETGVTKQIDTLADDGIVFTHARSSAPWTKPSVCSILTGLSPAVHQTFEREDQLPDSIETWAERFQHAGYQTAAFGFNHNLTARYNINQGFQTYGWYPSHIIPTPPLEYGLAAHIIGTPYLHIVTDTESLTALVSHWLAKNKNQNFFLWVHYLDPHMPYEPPSQFLPANQSPPEGMDTHFDDLVGVRRGLLCRRIEEQKWVRQLYRAEMEYVDDEVGNLLDSLRSFGIYDDALVILTSDHGEEFWEHGGFEHGHSLYEELLRVPLVLKPSGSETTTRIDVPVCEEDILPTVLELCQIKYDPLEFSGTSLTPLMDGSGNIPPRDFYASKLLYYEPCETVLAGTYKRIRYLETGKELVFDLESDPLEQSPIDPSPEVAERLDKARSDLERVYERLREHYATYGQEKITIDNWDAEQVRALGYL